jgi:hypothetical protein
MPLPMMELITSAVKLQRPMVRIRVLGWRCATLTPDELDGACCVLRVAKKHLAVRVSSGSLILFAAVNVWHRPFGGGLPPQGKPVLVESAQA